MSDKRDSTSAWETCYLALDLHHIYTTILSSRLFEVDMAHKQLTARFGLPGWGLGGFRVISASLSNLFIKRLWVSWPRVKGSPYCVSIGGLRYDNSPTGPSFTNATSIICSKVNYPDSGLFSMDELIHTAWKTPSLTLSIWYALCTWLTKWWYKLLAWSPPAAPWKSGLDPFRVSASSVNWETHSTSPSISTTLCFH